MNPKSTADLHSVDPIHIMSEVIPAHPHSDDYPSLYVCESSDDDYAITPSELSADDHTNERQGRVRFRDRVRITSGLKGHNHSHRGSRSDPAAEYIDLSSSSSSSSSRSSSISVPLRNEIEYADAKPGWGTLGQRVNIMAQHHAERKMLRDQRHRELLAKNIQLGMRLPSGEYGTERTPLMKSDAFLKLYIPRNPDGRILTASEREEYRQREIDQAFGPWPHRLWNHHWWWWHIEPVVCCHCVDEFEDEHC